MPMPMPMPMPITAIGLVVSSASARTIIGVCFDASDIQLFCEGMMDASQGPLYDTTYIFVYNFVFNCLQLRHGC